jgi:glycosyltransferase involved in cell wall biosynthesis
MQIAIDVTPLDSGHKNRGTGVYIKNIIEALQKYDKVNTYVFFKSNSKIPNGTNIVYHPYFDLFLLTLPLIHSIPRMVTVHDIIPLVFPEQFPAGIRGTIKSKIQILALSKSEQIFASSFNTRKDLVRITHLSEDKIKVVYLAASPIFTQPNALKTGKKIIDTYKLSDKYLLYVGDVNWNKNIIGLIKAFSNIKENSEYRDLKLCLVGKSFTNISLTETQEINKLINKYNITSEIITPGYIPDEDLKYIYSHAIAYIQPSLYEGFGFPVLEAMACGCPVITSDNSSLSEISGGSVKVSASDYRSISTGIIKILKMPDKEYKQIQSECLTWSSNFTWQKTVSSISSQYEKLVK